MIYAIEMKPKLYEGKWWVHSTYRNWSLHKAQEICERFNKDWKTIEARVVALELLPLRYDVPESYIMSEHPSLQTDEGNEVLIELYELSKVWVTRRGRSFRDECRQIRVKALQEWRKCRVNWNENPEATA